MFYNKIKRIEKKQRSKEKGKESCIIIYLYNFKKKIIKICFIIK